MSLQNILNQFLGPGNESSASNPTGGGSGGAVNKLISNIPGGLAGGAAAGGLMALLVSSKSARKVAGKAATYGGAAILGGLAYKVFQNWHSESRQQPQSTNQSQKMPTIQPEPQQFITSSADDQDKFELTLIKAMIAAAKADGHINSQEQQRIFEAVDRMDLTASEKGIVFECLQQDISIQELATAVDSLELKSEIYLVSCLAIDPDESSERAHLQQLASAMGLPEELAHQLEVQAIQTFSEAA